MEIYKIRELNLRRLLKESGETSDQFAKLIGTNPSYLSQTLSDASEKVIGDRFAKKIETALGKPAGWMDLVNHDTDDIQFISNNNDKWPMPTQWLNDKRLNLDCLKMITVAGDAMSPEIHDGDKVMVDQSTKTPEDGGIFVIETAHGEMVRRIVFRPDGNISIKPNNKRHDELVVPEVDGMIGKVVWLCRDVA